MMCSLILEPTLIVYICISVYIYTHGISRYNKIHVISFYHYTLTLFFYSKLSLDTIRHRKGPELSLGIHSHQWAQPGKNISNMWIETNTTGMECDLIWFKWSNRAWTWLNPSGMNSQRAHVIPPHDGMLDKIVIGSNHKIIGIPDEFFGWFTKQMDCWDLGVLTCFY